MSAKRNISTSSVQHHPEDAPPPYSALSNPEVLPCYASACPLKPYRAFPSVLRAYHRLSQLSSVSLYGREKEKDDSGSSNGAKESRLFHVTVHKGHGRTDVLGSRAGVLLHNGPSSRSEVLAAAGDESQFAARFYMYAVSNTPDSTSDSILFLPPFEFGTNSKAMVEERLRPGMTEEGTPTFTFFVEVEPIRKMRRQKFQWVQTLGSDDAWSRLTAFKLVKVARQAHLEDDVDDGDYQGLNLFENTATRSSISSSTFSPLRTEILGETVATLLFHQASPTRPLVFTLTMLGAASEGRLGERCGLAIVITALRIWNLRMKGRIGNP